MTKRKLEGVVKRGSCAFFALVMASTLSVPAAGLQALAAEPDLATTLYTQDSATASMTADDAIAEAFGCLWTWASDNNKTRPNQIADSKKGVLAKVYLGLTAGQQTLAKAKAPGFENAVKNSDSLADKATADDVTSAKNALATWANSATDDATKKLYHRAANSIDQILDGAGADASDQAGAMTSDQAMADAFGYLVGWAAKTADKPANVDPSYKGVLNEVYSMLTEEQKALIDSGKKQQFQNFQGQSAEKGLADFSSSVTVQSRNEAAKAVKEWAAATTDSATKTFYETAATAIADKLAESNSKAGDASSSTASKKANPITLSRTKATVSLKYSAVKKAAKNVKNVTVKNAKGKVTVKNASSNSKVKKWKVSYKSGKVIVTLC